MNGVGHIICFFPFLIYLGSKGTERTVVMDKSKGEPVISVKTSTTSKDRVSDASAWKTFSLKTDPESCQALHNPHLSCQFVQLEFL